MIDSEKKDQGSPRRGRLTSAGRIVLIVLLATISIFAFINVCIVEGCAYNADMAYLPALYRDIFVTAAPLAGWCVPPNPYLVPDMLLYFPLMAIAGGSISLAGAFYVAVFFVLVGSAMTYVVSHFVRVGTLAVLCIVAAMLLWAGLSRLDPRHVMSMYAWPSFHGGMILMGLLFLCCLLAIARGGLSPLRAVLLALVVATSITSDSVFGFQFLLPAIVVLAVLHSSPLMSRRRFLAVTGLVAISTGMGIVSLHLVRSFGPVVAEMVPSAHLRLTRMGDPIARSWELLRPLVLDNILAVILIGLVFVMAAAFLLTKAWRYFRNKPTVTSGWHDPYRQSALTFLAGFLVVSAVSSIGFPVLSELVFDQHDSAIRYMMPSYILPFLFLSLPLCILCSRGRPIIGKLLLCAVIGLSTFNLFRSGESLFPWRLPPNEPAFISFVDGLHDKYGVAAGYDYYWMAKPTDLYSRKGVRVNEIRMNLTGARSWINNLWWFIDRTEGRQAFIRKHEFIFAASHYIPESRIVAMFGEPAARHESGGDVALIYNRPSDLAFRNFIRSPVLSALGFEIGGQVHSPQSLGTFKPDFFPTYAPGVVTAPGNTELAITFKSPARGNVLEISAAFDDDCDVAIFSSGRQVGEVHVQPLSSHGMRRRYFSFPDSPSFGGIDRLIVKSRRPNVPIHIGHVFIYNDCY